MCSLLAVLADSLLFVLRSHAHNRLLVTLSDMHHLHVASRVVPLGLDVWRAVQFDPIIMCHANRLTQTHRQLTLEHVLALLVN